jgi:hypothetical protein
MLTDSSGRMTGKPEVSGGGHWMQRGFRPARREVVPKSPWGRSPGSLFPVGRRYRSYRVTARRSNLILDFASSSIELFDQSCNLLWPGYVDRVTGAGDFDLVAVGSCGIPPFEIGIDGSVCCGYRHPVGFASPRSRGDHGFEIVTKFNTCERAMNTACSADRSAAKYS